MDRITLKNFRCFREEQTARLAPLTLLVGENSTGKTSFLAMLRTLVDLAVDSLASDFKKDPYDLGSYDEIAHYRGGRSGWAETFEASFSAVSPLEENEDGDSKPLQFEVTFGRRGTVPVPVRRYFNHGDTWFEELRQSESAYRLRVGTHRGAWEKQMPGRILAFFGRPYQQLPPPILLLRFPVSEDDRKEDAEFRPLSGSPTFESEDMEMLESLAFHSNHLEMVTPFASAPVRSKPRRTYDPASPTPDPEGDYVPMYLADLFLQDRERWNSLKKRLESFGSASGLFDEISIRQLGERGSEPFQVQIRKFDGRQEGPPRNLIDVGYGVSQVLPVITELLIAQERKMFLLQQPEVHLHPSAQAALGSLFCQVAAEGHQIVVETHSDYLLDRVRMEVRDGTADLRPNDVSILYFERDNLDVKIHSIRMDEEGNISGAPDSYRSFFMEETVRSLWKRQPSLGT